VCNRRSRTTVAVAATGLMVGLIQCPLTGSIPTLSTDYEKSTKTILNVFPPAPPISHTGAYMREPNCGAENPKEQDL
jgi:hypothetical protein